jgi:hypothetical protein
MIRIDVPKVGDAPRFSKLYNPSAIYGITPTDEATARAAACSFETAHWITMLSNHSSMSVLHGFNLSRKK